MSTVDAKQVLNDYGIKTSSVGGAIKQIGDVIDDSRDPLSLSNSIINQLGGIDQYDLVSAKILAKALIEQAMVQDPYDSDKATKAAEGKLEKIRKDMPYVFAKPEEESASAPTAKQSAIVDKKARAQEIFNANKTLTNGEIAKLIQDDLKITYANAYYYVSRVFKR